jgi:GntR family transcriptional regulator, rspAB operon transcriptional repressor
MDGAAQVVLSPLVRNGLAADRDRRQTGARYAILGFAMKRTTHPRGSTGGTQRKPARGGKIRRDVAPESRRSSAYEAIKLRIITGAFKPGDYINELQLSSLLKIGRTPVHQALDRLMLESMVEVIPRKGVIVKPISLNELLQIIEVRLINECYCARLAAEHANDADLFKMEEVLRQASQWASMRDIVNMILVDREFHLLLARAAKKDVVAGLLRNLHERSLRFWFISLNEPSQCEIAHEQHVAILRAIRRRDPERAEAEMRRHIESYRTSVSQFL